MNNILTSNIPIETSEKAIRGLFVAYGAVERIKIVTDRHTARPTGRAFVEMVNDADAIKAIAAVDGAELNGCILKVNAARPQLHRHLKRQQGQA